MILSLSRSPDAQQGLAMASHGQSGRVQSGFRAHSAPKPQGTPSRLPTNSPTAASAMASAHRPTGPARTHRARVHGMTVPQRGYTRALAGPVVSPRPTVSAHVAGSAGPDPLPCRGTHSLQPAAELHTRRQHEKRVRRNRVPSGSTASHAHSSAPSDDSGLQSKHMRQHNAPRGRHPLQ